MSAQVLSPPNPSGSVGTVCRCSKVPAVPSYEQNRHRRIELVDQIRKLAAGMESDVARTGSRFHLDQGTAFASSIPRFGSNR